MGLLSWLFPNDEDRLASARALMAKGQHEKARKVLLHCSLPEAEALYDECSAAVDEVERADAKKRLVKEGFRGWKVQVTMKNERRKKELEALVAQEIQKAGVDMTDPEVDREAVQAAVAKAQRKAARAGMNEAGTIKLVPVVDNARAAR